MNARTPIRTSGAIWFVPLVFAVAVWMGVSNLWGRTGYSVADLSVTNLGSLYAAPMTAAWVAFRLPGFFRIVSVSRPLRGRARILLSWWGPVLIGAPIASVLASLSAARAWPDQAFAWWLITLQFATIAAAAGLGMLITRALPVVVGVPLVAVGLFVWLAYPDAGSNTLLRNLDSSAVSCCGHSSRPATAFLLGSGLIDLIVILGSVTLCVSARWARRSRPVLLGGLIATLGVALGAGAAGAMAAPGKLDFNSAAARTGELRCAAEAHHRVCLWPEHRDALQSTLAAFEAFDRAVTRAGLPGADAVSEDSRAGFPALVITVPDTTTPDRLRQSLVEGYVSRATTCHGSRPRNELPPTIPQALAGLLAGQSPAEVRTVQGEDALAAAQQVLAAPSAVAAWFETHTCPRPSTAAR